MKPKHKKWLKEFRFFIKRVHAPASKWRLDTERHEKEKQK